MLLSHFRWSFLLLLLVLSPLVRAQVIDSDFNPRTDSYVYALAAQPQLGDRVIVGGAFHQLAGRTRDFIGRLNADGSFDGSFATTVDGVVQCIVPQPDGKILIGGQFNRVNGIAMSRIARLNADGTLDPFFNSGLGVSNTIRSMVLQPDGRILIGGAFDTVGREIRNGLARLNADGSLDAAFNPNVITLRLPPVAPGVFCVALQPDGKIVFGGQFGLVSGRVRNGIARVNADGSLDAEFDPSPRPGTFHAVVSLPNGKIIVGGAFSELGGRAQSDLVRLNRDGSADPGFAFNANGSVSSVFVQRDGRLLVSGFFTLVSGQLHIGWARLASFGEVDGNFDFDLEAADRFVNSPINAVLTQPDGNMVWAGNFKSVGGVARDNLVRTATLPDAPARLANLSARGFIAAGGDLVVGFITSGGPKSLLLRAVGPTLGSLGVIGALAAPRLEAIPSAAITASDVNTGWGGGAALSTAFTGVGAFPLPVTSGDAALLTSSSGGSMTARVTSAVSGGSGIALAEIYDRDSTIAPGRLANLSTLGFVGSGGEALIPGFVIVGRTSKLLLIRAVGPGLTPFGVTGVLADPQLAVISQGAIVPVASNDNWAGEATVTAAFNAAGAFALPNTSTDAAVLVQLSPGAYTVTVTGAGTSTGRALVEIYDLDP